MIERTWPWTVALAAALALTALAGWKATDLSVSTRIEEMLPAGSPAADDYRRFLDRFGGFEKVYAMVVWEAGDDGPPPDAALLAEAAGRLGERLEALPEVAASRSGLTAADEDFLRRLVLPRGALFLGDDDTARERLDTRAVRLRAAEIRRAVTGPGGAQQARWLAADPLGFAGDLAELGGGAMGFIDPLTGGFLSPAGDVALVVVTPASGELDAAAGRALAAGIDAAAAALADDFPDAPLAVVAVGGPLYAAQDEAAIRGDLTTTITGSAFAVTLLLVLYFGTLGTPVALLVAVASGVAWTAGFTALVHGEVSVLGISFAAMLLGLGVDYGIHGASRFRAARIEGVAPPAALGQALGDVGPAVLASAATTAAAFLVLSLAHFRPVRELGLVMAGGILALLAATLAVGAPAFVLAGRWSKPPRRWHWRATTWRGLGRGVHFLVYLGLRNARWVAAAALAVTLLAGWGITRLDVSLDLRSLRPTDHPAFAAEELLVDRFALGLDAATVVVEAGDLDAALSAARRVETALAGRLPEGSDVSSPVRWLPTAAVVERRLAALGGEPAAAAAADLRAALAEQGLAERPFADALAVLDAAGRGEAPLPIRRDAWPDWVAEQVRPGGGDGSGEAASAAVAIRVATPLGAWAEGPPAELLAAVAAAAGESGARVAVASVPRLGAELRRSIVRDFRALGGWALAAVLAVVLVAFRGHPRRSLLALAPVVVGGVWTLGFAGWVGLPLDPFAVVVAPLLLGLGIDDGLHAVAGERRFGSVWGSLLENGRAMTLTTLTTCAGFGSLALSRVPSLARGGVLVAVGAFCCLLATLLVLPAVTALWIGKAGWGKR